MDKFEHFWQNLRTISSTDTSVDVPESSRRAALSLFKVDKQPLLQRVFSLSPVSLAAVRKASVNQKFLYELNEYVVQLEQTEGDAGFQLSGFVHGIEDGPVTLYGNESIFETEINESGFNFDSVPFGSYQMSFSNEGETYWIKGLQLNPEAMS